MYYLLILFIVKFVRNQQEYFADKLKEAMNGIKINTNTLARIIIERSEIDLAEINQVYDEKYKPSSLISDLKSVSLYCY